MGRKKKEPKKKNTAVKSAQPTLHFYHVEVSQERFLALSVETRYCILLLSHIQHEISWLQRMMHIAAMTPLQSDTDLGKNGKIMQASLVLRLLLGKLNEFRISLNKTAIIRKFLEDWYEPNDLSAGAAKIEAVIALFDSNPWLGAARNKHFLHYPTLNDVRDTLENPNVEWRFDMYVADSSMNSLCPTADIMANLAWFSLVDSEDAMTGLDRAYDSMTKISRDVLDILEMAVGSFVHLNVSPVMEGKRVSMKAQASVNEMDLPFFMAGNEDV